MVMGHDSCLRDRGFESRRRILDGYDIFHIYWFLKLYGLLLKTENKRKRGWPIFKKKLLAITSS